MLITMLINLVMITLSLVVTLGTSDCLHQSILAHDLQTSYFRVSERDVLMSREHYLDLRDRLGISDLSTQIDLPQVFLNGQLLGVGINHLLTSLLSLSMKDAALMERINESGELRKLVKPLQVILGYP